MRGVFSPPFPLSPPFPFPVPFFPFPLYFSRLKVALKSSLGIWGTAVSSPQRGEGRSEGANSASQIL